jgi:hypothetical protein
MRSTHKINHGWMIPSDIVDESYQRQVDRSTERNERVYAAAVKRLEAAEQRLSKVSSIKSPVARARETKAASRAVEARRQELLAVQALMSGTPAGSQNRGIGSYRPIPSGQTI